MLSYNLEIFLYEHEFIFEPEEGSANNSETLAKNAKNSKENLSKPPGLPKGIFGHIYKQTQI